MLSRKAKRRLIRGSLGGLAVLSLLYAFRWPLLERPLIGAVRKKAVQALKSDVRIGDLSGTLVSSVRATNVVLAPQPGSAFRAGRIARLDVRYGFLGVNGLHLDVRGARLELAASDKPAPPVQDVVRQVFTSIHTAEVPADIDLKDAAVVLSDGSELRIERARLRDDQVSARLRHASFGIIDLSGRRGPDREVRLRAAASGGPVTELRLDLEPGAGPEQPLRVEAKAGRERFSWQGRVRYDSGGPSLIEGDLTVREGKATTKIDLRSGATDIEWNAGVTLDQDISADITGRGRIRGSLAEPLDRWIVSEGLIRASAVRVKGCEFSGEISISEGTLAGVPWRGRATCGADEARAEGTISWNNGFGLQAEVTLEAADLRSYGGFLPEDLKAEAVALRLRGRAEVGATGPCFEGSLWVGKGQASGIAWESIRWAGRVTGHEAVTCELAIEGIPAAPSISLLGSVRLEKESRAIEFDLAGPEIVLGPPAAGVLTDFAAKGRLDPLGIDLATLEGKLDHGPFRAIGRWEFRTPRKEARLHLVGRNMLVLSDKLGRVRASPNVWFTGNAEEGWTLDGSLELPTVFFYGELGDPHASREGKVKEAAAPKLRLIPAPEGGFQLPAGLGGGERVALDLELRTTREARIENSSLAAMLDAELRLGGTLAMPAVSGRVRARRGEVKLATGVFIRIERLEASLPQQAGQAGTLYFKGRSGKGQGAITVVIAGPLHDPVLSLTSDPPRKQEELLAILAFGKAPGSVSGQDALGTLAVKAFEKATDSWPRAEPREGFWDRLSLSVANEENPDPEKRAPWQLPPTASARGTIVRTEYLLNAFLSVVVESDRQANVSGDLKIRFHFR